MFKIAIEIEIERVYWRSMWIKYSCIELHSEVSASPPLKPAVK